MTAYIRTPDGAVFESDDGGENWRDSEGKFAALEDINARKRIMRATREPVERLEITDVNEQGEAFREVFERKPGEESFVSKERVSL